MANFQIGNTVKLISGGPNMTVADTTPPNIKCHWFNSTTNLFQYDTFDPGELAIVTGEGDNG